MKELQALLIASGADLAIDGDLGALTDSAIREFQEANGLTIDGIVGPKTLKALRQKASALCSESDTSNQPVMEPQPTP